jgi:hypothetical protein
MKAPSRRERLMQRLRAKHPGKSDDWLNAYIAANASMGISRDNTQFGREVAQLEADGNALLAKMAARPAQCHAAAPVQAPATQVRAVAQPSAQVPVPHARGHHVHVPARLVADLMHARNAWRDSGSQREGPAYEELQRLTRSL